MFMEIIKDAIQHPFSYIRYCVVYILVQIAYIGHALILMAKNIIKRIGMWLLSIVLFFGVVYTIEGNLGRFLHDLANIFVGYPRH